MSGTDPNKISPLAMKKAASTPTPGAAGSYRANTMGTKIYSRENMFFNADGTLKEVSA